MTSSLGWKRLALIAALIAISTISVIVLLMTGIGYQWTLVRPLINAVIDIEPIWLGLTLAYLVGFMQFFVLSLAGLMCIVHGQQKAQR